MENESRDPGEGDLTIAVGVMGHSSILSDDYRWVFYETDQGQKAGCNTQQPIVFKGPVFQGANIDEPGNPGGEYDMKIWGRDCEFAEWFTRYGGAADSVAGKYSSDGNNPGDLICGGDKYSCTSNSNAPTETCPGGQKQHEGVFCDFDSDGAASVVEWTPGEQASVQRAVASLQQMDRTGKLADTHSLPYTSRQLLTTSLFCSRYMQLFHATRVSLFLEERPRRLLLRSGKRPRWQRHRRPIGLEGGRREHHQGRRDDQDHFKAPLAAVHQRQEVRRLAQADRQLEEQHAFRFHLCECEMAGVSGAAARWGGVPAVLYDRLFLADA